MFKGLSGLPRWFERFGGSLALVLVCIGLILLVSFVVTVSARRAQSPSPARLAALLERALHISSLALVADLALAMFYNLGVGRFFRDDIPAWVEGISRLLYLGLIASVTTLTGVLVLAALLVSMGGQGEQGAMSRFNRSVERVLFQIVGVLLLLVLAGVFYNTIARYFFNRPELWSEAAPRVFYLWMTYLAVAVGTKRGANIRVTFFIDKMEPLRRLLLEVVMHALVMIMIVTVVWHNFPLLRLGLRGTMLATGWSNVVSFLPLTVGGVFILFYQALLIPKAFAAYRATGAPALTSRAKSILYYIIGAVALALLLRFVYRTRFLGHKFVSCGGPE